jgi:chromate reductase, NAD(P)H dehydrogenase (quinone)
LLSQAAWLPVLRTLGTLPYFEGRLGVSGAAKVFDSEGHIIDDAIRARLQTFVSGFVAFADEINAMRRR